MLCLLDTLFETPVEICSDVYVWEEYSNYAVVNVGFGWFLVVINNLFITSNE